MAMKLKPMGIDWGKGLLCENGQTIKRQIVNMEEDWIER
jgi:hypothetical protein